MALLPLANRKVHWHHGQGAGMWQGSIHPCPEAASKLQPLFIIVTVWGCDLLGLQRSIIYRQVRPCLYRALHTARIKVYSTEQKVNRNSFNKLKLKHRNYRLINNEEETIL